MKPIARDMRMTTPTIAEALDNPTLSHSLKLAIRDASRRDIVDALRDAESLVAILKAHYQLMHGQPDFVDPNPVYISKSQLLAGETVTFEVEVDAFSPTNQTNDKR